MYNKVHSLGLLVPLKHVYPNTHAHTQTTTFQCQHVPSFKWKIALNWQKAKLQEYRTVQYTFLSQKILQ